MKVGNLKAIDTALKGRRLHYAHNGDDRSAFLRGAPLFEVLQRRYLANPFRHTHRYVTMDSAMLANGPADEVLFLFTPGVPVIAEELARRQKAHMPVIMDMHADLLQLLPEGAASDRMREAGETTTREAWAYWWHPDRQAVIHAAMDVVSVITTPWVELVSPLGLLTRCPVVYVPDFDEQRPTDFATDFGYALTLAVKNA
jgi:hypothetical protein